MRPLRPQLVARVLRQAHHRPGAAGAQELQALEELFLQAFLAPV